MKISSEKIDIKKTYLAVTTMLMAILCVDLYMVVIKFLGNEYSVIQLAVFRNIAGVIPLILLILYTKEHFTIFKNLNKTFMTLSFFRGLAFLSMNIFIFISVINLGLNANFLAMWFGTFPQMKPNVFRRHLRNEIAMSPRFIRIALNNGSGLCVHCDEFFKRARRSQYNN